MINYIDAKEKLLNVSPLSGIIISSLDSLDRICYDDVYSKCNLPFYNNSAMDGYAINFNETRLATQENPLFFKVIGCQLAGIECDITNFFPFCVIEIMTGAVLPKFFNSVIKKEDVEIVYINNIKYIVIKKFVLNYENVKIIGEDVLKYDLIIKKGKIITSSDIMLLLSLGIFFLKVYKNPEIILICTGEELLNNNNFFLFDNYIYNSTYFYLKSFFYRLKMKFYYYGEIVDNIKIFMRVVKRILILDSPEILMSTGSVSKGKCDFILSALNLMNAIIYFNGLFIKPGKPLIFAKFRNFCTYFFGLPGNPISSIVCVRFFVYPFIRKCFSLPEEFGMKVKLSHSMIKKIGFTVFLKSFLFKMNGVFFVDCMYEQESFKIYSFTKTFFWVLLQSDKKNYKANEYVEVFCYEPYSWKNVLYDE